MKGSILDFEWFQSYEYLRYMLLKGLDMAFDVWLMKRGREQKRKVNKLLRKEESELQECYKDAIDKAKSTTKTRLTSKTRLRS